MASRSIELATTPSAAKNAAWRSRGITCVETGSTFNPSFVATCASTRGSILANVPTAPEMAQTEISSRAAISRALRALEFGIIARELHAEGRRLGMDAVAAPDGDGVLEFEGALLQRRQQQIDIGNQHIGRALQLHRQARIQHIRRRHALMHEARFRPHDLGKMGEERDDIVLHFALDGVDALDIECRPCRPSPR